MLKKITLALMLILPMGVFAQTLKFGHVNSQEVILAMPEFTKAQDDLKALDKKLSDELQRTNDEFQKKYQEFQQSTDLPANIAERRQKELEDMYQRQAQFQQEAQETLRKTQEELMMPIYQKLENAIKAVGQSGNYTYIFDLGRTSIPYINDSQSTDVTSAVKTQLGIK